MDKNDQITIPGTIWMTGLSGAGKSTMAQALSAYLTARGVHHVILDGDVIRKGLCHDLGFSAQDRTENLRRVREVAALLQDAGIMTCVACITPFEHQRAHNKARLNHYLEVHINCSLETCMARDPKGLYQRALHDELQQFTGISSPFEWPNQADLTLDTEHLDIEQCLELLINALTSRGWIADCPEHKQE